MLASFLITFREALEAALIIGIISAYVAKIGRKDLNRYINIGIIGALIASLAVAMIFKTVYGDLSGTAEQLFGGTADLAAAIVLTYMIFWMANNSRQVKGEVQEKIDLSISKGNMLGIAGLSFIAVFREGVETVLFLGTLAINNPVDTISGFFIGLAAIIVLSFIMFKGTYSLDVGKFFRYTSFILILFSAGLVATGVHDFNDAGVIPYGITHVWDLNPPLNPDGSYPLLHDNGLIGGSLKALVGYNAAPSLTEVLAYIGYWIIIGPFIYRNYKTGTEVKNGS
ncbi:MAG: FTR1 family protein [Candidatus Methanoperedens sp.]|nr:FTR1 family protein [Candidatus Methanoperedens sp.]